MERKKDVHLEQSWESGTPGEFWPRCMLQKHRKYLLPSQSGLEVWVRNWADSPSEGNQVGALLSRHTARSLPGGTVSGTLRVVGKGPWLLLPAVSCAPKLSGRLKNNASTEVKLGLDPPYRTFRLDKVKRIINQARAPRSNRHLACGHLDHLCL